MQDRLAGVVLNPRGEAALLLVMGCGFGGVFGGKVAKKSKKLVEIY